MGQERAFDRGGWGSRIHAGGPAGGGGKIRRPMSPLASRPPYRPFFVFENHREDWPMLRTGEWHGWRWHLEWSRLTKALCVWVPWRPRHAPLVWWNNRGL